MYETHGRSSPLRRKQPLKHVLQALLSSGHREKVALSIAAPFPKDDQSAAEQYPAEGEFPLDVPRRNRPIIPAFEFRSPARVPNATRNGGPVEGGTLVYCTEGVPEGEKRKLSCAPVGSQDTEKRRNVTRHMNRA